MTRRILFPLLVLSLTLAGCDLWDHSGDDPGDGGDDPDSSVLLPLDEGTAWVMAFTRYNAEGDLTESYTDTLRIVGDTTIAGERWAEIRCTQSPNLCVPGGFYTNREDGVWKWANPSSDEAPYLVYKYPAEVGDAYDLPGSSNTTVTVLDIEEPVETPSGPLSAYHYEFETTEANGYPVSEGAGRFDRYLVPEHGFAVIDCAYLTPNDEGELDTFQTFGWELIAFLDG